MFLRLAEHYRSLIQDLVLSLQALATGLQASGISAACYVCGTMQDNQGASFVAEIGEQHLIRFQVSDCGISWVESRNGHELVKLEGGDAIQELHRIAERLLHQSATGMPQSDIPSPA